jgi:hypothetical protein
MAAKKKIEYGLMVAPIGTINSDKSMTKVTFFEKMEEQYPSAEGWEVYSTSVEAGTSDAVLVAYHLKKVNG